VAGQIKCEKIAKTLTHDFNIFDIFSCLQDFFAYRITDKISGK